MYYICLFSWGLFESNFKFSGTSQMQAVHEGYENTEGSMPHDYNTNQWNRKVVVVGVLCFILFLMKRICIPFYTNTTFGVLRTGGT